MSELHGVKNSSDINDARYEKFCTKGAMPESHQLPPTQDAFHWPLQRAHYKALTWKSALQCDSIIPSPEGYGWTVSAQNHLQIYWTSLPPAPDAVLNMISCACTKSKCAAGGCSCLLYVSSALTSANAKTAKILLMKAATVTKSVMRTRLILTPATL